MLDGVSLRLEPGEHLALVGPTGAGKSTLAKLLTRHYDPKAGEVAFGGVDLRDTTHAALRRRIVFLPQEGHLFSGSIADNVRLGRPDASDDDVAEALGRIGVYDRFAALPDGLQTDVRTRGVRLSSGERQLVGLARVALADPDVIVLDEATSNLDPQTESLVERGAGRRCGRAHDDHDRAPALDRRAGRPRRRARPAAGWSRSPRTTSCCGASSHYARLWASWQAGVGEGPAPRGGRTRARRAAAEDEGGHARRPPEPPAGRVRSGEPLGASRGPPRAVWRRARRAAKRARTSVPAEQDGDGDVDRERNLLQPARVVPEPPDLDRDQRDRRQHRQHRRPRAAR